MIQAFMDESGTHETSRVTCVAVYASTPDQWAAFEADWIPFLVEAGVEYFHATDKRCEKLKAPLTRCLRRHLIQGWVVSARPEHYKTHSGDQLKSLLGNYYAIASISCANAVCRWAKENSLGPVSFVIEDGQPNAEFVRDAIQKLMGHGDYEAASVVLGGKRDAVPLQAADFLAHSISTLNLPWIKKLVGAGQGQALWANHAEEEFGILSRGSENVLRKWRHMKQVKKNARKGLK